MKVKDCQIIKLVGKTEYGKSQIKKHGELWFVLQIVGGSMEILDKKRQQEYKWVELKGPHYYYIEHVPNNGKKKKQAQPREEPGSS